MEGPLNCVKCKRTLEMPVLLPCGDSICKRHVCDALEINSSKIHCDVCKLDHEIPDGGFAPNNLVKCLIDRKLQVLDLGPEHRAAKKSLRELKMQFNEVKRIMHQPEMEINRVMCEMKGQIDLRREEAKKSIDDEAMGLIQDLEEYEKKCMGSRGQAKIRVSKETEDMLKTMEDNLVSWTEQMNSYDGGPKKWKLIHVDSVLSAETLSDKCGHLKRKLLADEYDQFETRLQKFCRKGSASLMTIRVKCSNLKETRQFKSDTVTNLGVDWFLKVYIEKNGDDDNVSIYLHATPQSSTCHLFVENKLMLLNRICSKKSLVKENDNNFGFGGSWGFSSFIKLSDLKANKLYYDEDQDCFTVQANIFDVKWIKI